MDFNIKMQEERTGGRNTCRSKDVRVRRSCQSGPDCEFFKQGRCRFFHEKLLTLNAVAGEAQSASGGARSKSSDAEVSTLNAVVGEKALRVVSAAGGARSKYSNAKDKYEDKVVVYDDIRDTVVSNKNHNPGFSHWQILAPGSKQAKQYCPEEGWVLLPDWKKYYYSRGKACGFKKKALKVAFYPCGKEIYLRNPLAAEQYLRQHLQTTGQIRITSDSESNTAITTAPPPSTSTVDSLSQGLNVLKISADAAPEALNNDNDKGPILDPNLRMGKDGLEQLPNVCTGLFASKATIEKLISESLELYEAGCRTGEDDHAELMLPVPIELLLKERGPEMRSYLDQQFFESDYFIKQRISVNQIVREEQIVRRDETGKLQKETVWRRNMVSLDHHLNQLRSMRHQWERELSNRPGYEDMYVLVTANMQEWKEKKKVYEIRKDDSRHGRKAESRYWEVSIDLPGGKRDLGETLHTATVRETWEETGILFTVNGTVDTAGAGGEWVFGMSEHRGSVLWPTVDGDCVFEGVPDAGGDKAFSVAIILLD